METDLRMLYVLTKFSINFVATNVFSKISSNNNVRKLISSVVMFLVIVITSGIYVYGLVHCLYRTSRFLRDFESFFVLLLAITNLYIVVCSSFYEKLQRFLRSLINIENQVIFSKRPAKIYSCLLVMVIVLTGTFATICILDYYNFYHQKLINWCLVYQLPKYLLIFNVFVTALTAFTVLCAVNRRIIVINRTLSETANEFLTLPAEELIQLDEKSFLITGWTKNALQKKKNSNFAVNVRIISHSYKKLYNITTQIKAVYNLLFSFFMIVQISECLKLFIGDYIEASNTTITGEFIIIGRCLPVILMAVSFF